MIDTELSRQFYIQQFYQYAGWPKYNKHNNTYNACCPLCREGRSWGKKKRLYYIVDKNVVCCHNCGWYGNTLKWLLVASNKTYDELISEADAIDITDIESRPTTSRVESSSLPLDSIDVFDKTQLKYHFQNRLEKSIITQALKFILERRLHVACNRPKAMYISVSDKIHKNRLCIPFTSGGKVVHYQTRGIFSVDLISRPKYLSRLNSEKTLFNIDNIKPDIETIYILEGPLDAFFVVNGIAIAGVQENSSQLFTRRQSLQIKTYPLHKKVWCLDSQHLDKASYQKTSMLISQNQHVFIWPVEEGRKYKDFNDMCIALDINEISRTWLDDNTYQGEPARLKMSMVRLEV